MLKRAYAHAFAVASSSDRGTELVGLLSAEIGISIIQRGYLEGSSTFTNSLCLVAMLRPLEQELSRLYHV
jgi:hypothetical protein